MFGGIFGGNPAPSPVLPVPAKDGVNLNLAFDKLKEETEQVQFYKGTGIDPTGIEELASLATRIDKSNAARELTQELTHQEKLKREEVKKKIDDIERNKHQLMDEYRRKRAEEARKYGEEKDRLDKKISKYVDQLERKRQADVINAKQQMHEEERKRKEDSMLRQEATHRKTLEYEAELRQKTELQRVEAETMGRIRQERENHDLKIEKTKVKAKELRETIMESIKLTSQTLGTGISSFLSDREKMGSAVLTASALALGIYTAKVSTGIIGRFVEARLGKPSLVRETSRMTLKQIVAHPFSVIKNSLKGKHSENALKGVILEPELEQRLLQIAVATENTKKNCAPFRHLLLYGPPGTGKTLFAKGLAKHSGLEYAILTGGDVAPLGSQAVTEIHKLFDWANTSKKGLLLFVDEADAFLRKRNVEKISEDLRNALNAFLFRTGTETDKFMVIYASNQPDQFDWAINDRIDEMVEFRLPGFEERFRMIDYYLQKYLQNPEQKKARIITVQGVGQEDIDQVAQLTENFSGREISKLAIAWQAAAFGSEGAIFTREMMFSVLETHIEQKKQKKVWLNDRDFLTGNV